jgi:hypothetical protein
MKIGVVESLNESSNPQVPEDISHDSNHAGDQAERQRRNNSDFPQMIFLDPDADLCAVPYRFDVGSVSMIALDRSLR